MIRAQDLSVAVVCHTAGRASATRQKASRQAVYVRAAFEASGRTYGNRRVAQDLDKQGMKIGRYRARTLMRQENLRPVWKRKLVATTDSWHGRPVAPNVLSRQFRPEQANRAWVSGIMYAHTRAQPTSTCRRPQKRSSSFSEWCSEN